MTSRCHDNHFSGCKQNQAAIRTPLLIEVSIVPGADPGFFLGGSALVSRSTSTPINHIVLFFAEYQLY